MCSHVQSWFRIRAVDNPSIFKSFWVFSSKHNGVHAAAVALSVEWDCFQLGEAHMGGRIDWGSQASSSWLGT